MRLMNRLAARRAAHSRPATAFISRPEPRTIGSFARGRQLVAGNFLFAGHLVEAPDTPLWALDMPFMKRHSPSYLARHPEKKGADLEATRKACEKFRHTPTSVINFIEGTRFSEAKRRARQSPYRHLLPPRAGGIAVALSAMGEVFDAILDVTLNYAGEPPKFWDMICGDRVDVTLDIRALPIDPELVAGDYQNDREFRRVVHRWLGTLWEEKDARIAEIRGHVT